MIIDTTQSGSLGGSGLFLPRDFAGVLVDFDFSHPNAGADQPANNASLSGIVNKGRGTVTASQATGANQSTFILSAGGNGLVRADGSDYYSVSGLTLLASFSMFLVAAPSTVAGYYFGTSNTVGRGPTFISGFTNGATNNYEYYNSGTDRIVLSASATGQNLCEAHQVDGVSLETRFNGTIISTITPTVAAAGRTLDTLFASVTTSNPLAADVKRIVIATPVLTALQAAQIRSYLNQVCRGVGT